MAYQQFADFVCVIDQDRVSAVFLAHHDHVAVVSLEVLQQCERLRVDTKRYRLIRPRGAPDFGNGQIHERWGVRVLLGRRNITLTSMERILQTPSPKARSAAY